MSEITITTCANCSGNPADGGDLAWTKCRENGGCPCACHLGSAQIEMCEFGTDPFTDAERAALARYNCRVLGVPDCFDCNELAGIPAEFTVPEVTGMFRSFYGLLTEWRTAIRTLHDDLIELGLNHTVPISNPHGEAFRIMPVSLAAWRYLQAEVADYLAARDGHRTLVIEYFLGHDESGDKFDYIHQGEESLHDWSNQG